MPDIDRGHGFLYQIVTSFISYIRTNIHVHVWDCFNVKFMFMCLWFSSVHVYCVDLELSFRRLLILGFGLGFFAKDCIFPFFSAISFLGFMGGYLCV